MFLLFIRVFCSSYCLGLHFLKAVIKSKLSYFLTHTRIHVYAWVNEICTCFFLETKKPNSVFLFLIKENDLSEKDIKAWSHIRYIEDKLPRSPDLTTVDLSLWEHLKQFVHRIHVNTEIQTLLLVCMPLLHLWILQ